MDKFEAAKEIIRVAKELLSYDFPNKKELIKYVHEHPRANPKNHRVVRNPKRLPKQLKDPEKYKDYHDKELDKGKVKKIRERLKKHSDKDKEDRSKALHEIFVNIYKSEEGHKPPRDIFTDKQKREYLKEHDDKMKGKKPSWLKDKPADFGQSMGDALDKAKKDKKEDESAKNVAPKTDIKKEEKPKVDEKKQQSLNKRRYTLSKNKHLKNYANYNFDANPDKKQSPWKNMSWNQYLKYAKNATHIGHALLHEHGFDEEAMKDIRDVRKNKFGRRSKLTPAEIKQKYMDNMNQKNFSSPQALQKAKARIQKMNPNDFLVVFRSILAEEKDEDDVIQNMKNIKNNQGRFLKSPTWSGETAHKTW
jgi:hypothetical protein